MGLGKTTAQTPFGVCREGKPVPASPDGALAAARDPFDFRLDDALHQSGQIIVQPGFQHRPQHLLDEIFQRPRIVAQHRMSEAVEGGFDGGHGRG